MIKEDILSSMEKKKLLFHKRKKVNNILYINKTSDESIPLMASIKSISE